ncbi:biotin transporter BioY [Streptococcus merionis]|uniref:biotin transporter BioY n=1 Tax=Streptococcus merionis TaxID=400065 RepID=UPI003516EE49
MKTKDLTQITMMTTLMIVLGFVPGIPLGFIPVPIILQNLAVMLAGALLGAKKGTVSVLLVLLLGVFIPVFSGKSTTIPVLMGPTAGYVLAWVFVPLLIGWGLSRVEKGNPTLTFLVIWLAGVLFIDSFGALWLALYTQAPIGTTLVSNLIFIPGDTIKALLATLIALRMQKMTGDLFL